MYHVTRRFCGQQPVISPSQDATVQQVATTQSTSHYPDARSRAHRISPERTVESHVSSEKFVDLDAGGDCSEPDMFYDEDAHRVLLNFHHDLEQRSAPTPDSFGSEARCVSIQESRQQDVVLPVPREDLPRTLPTALWSSIPMPHCAPVLSSVNLDIPFHERKRQPQSGSTFTASPGFDKYAPVVTTPEQVSTIPDRYESYVPQAEVSIDLALVNAMGMERQGTRGMELLKCSRYDYADSTTRVLSRDSMKFLQHINNVHRKDAISWRTFHLAVVKRINAALFNVKRGAGMATGQDIKCIGGIRKGPNMAVPSILFRMALSQKPGTPGALLEFPENMQVTIDCLFEYRSSRFHGKQQAPMWTPANFKIDCEVRKNEWDAWVSHVLPPAATPICYVSSRGAVAIPEPAHLPVDQAKSGGKAERGGWRELFNWPHLDEPGCPDDLRVHAPFAWKLAQMAAESESTLKHHNIFGTDVDRALSTNALIEKFAAILEPSDKLTPHAAARAFLLVLTKLVSNALDRIGAFEKSRHHMNGKIFAVPAQGGETITKRGGIDCIVLGVQVDHGDLAKYTDHIRLSERSRAWRDGSAVFYIFCELQQEAGQGTKRKRDDANHRIWMPCDYDFVDWQPVD